MDGSFSSIKKSIRRATGRKHHLDFVVALLTIPMILTLIISNWMNIKSKEEPTPTPAQEKQIIIQEKSDNATTPKIITQEKIIQVTPAQDCNKIVGPISITDPSENQKVSDNPTCITIRYEDPNYCSVVWSYRINNNSWSDYNSNSVCLYNLPKGEVKFDLRVQSTVSSDTTTLNRKFLYEGNINPTPATSSAIIN